VKLTCVYAPTNNWRGENGINRIYKRGEKREGRQRENEYINRGGKERKGKMQQENTLVSYLRIKYTGKNKCNK